MLLQVMDFEYLTMPYDRHWAGPTGLWCSGGVWIDVHGLMVSDHGSEFDLKVDSIVNPWWYRPVKLTGLQRDCGFLLGEVMQSKVVKMDGISDTRFLIRDSW